MKMRDKLDYATRLAMRVKSIASSIKRECQDYDETWALSYAGDLDRIAEEFLNLK